MNPQETLIRAIDLTRYYRRGVHEVRALDGVSLDFQKGEFSAIVGASGSGKSTLLSILAGLHTPTSGTVMVSGESLYSMTRRQLSAYRAKRVGVIFQSFNLISHLTALQNVEMALYFDGTPPRERKNRAIQILERLGLADRTSHRPADLSGGEQQRVAIARAVVKHPEILFADEPTGNLDRDNALQIGDLLDELNREGLTVIMVTHNMEMARQHASRIIPMRFGAIATGGAPGIQAGTGA